MKISLQSINKSFKSTDIQNSVLKDITCEFYQNEITAVVGPSGSGKSTLLSLIGSLDKPTSGEIVAGEQNITSLTNKELSQFRFNKIGFIFQQFHLIPSLTVLENIMAPLLIKRTNYHKRERAISKLGMVGLKEKASFLPSQLSGGQQQRVAIARALVNEPQWILADEPTGNLDSENGAMIFEIIQSLNIEKKCGIIFVTHDMNLAQKADRIIYMKDGEITEDKRGNMIC